MTMKIGEDNFTLLDEEKKAKILQNLNQEIERQKAKYLLSGNRMRETNEIKKEQVMNSYNPQKQNPTNDYDNHIDMLESAKDNLKKIQTDIQNMNNNNYIHSNNQNDNHDYIEQGGSYENYEQEDEEHLDENIEKNYQLQDEGEFDEEEIDPNQKRYEESYRPYNEYYPRENPKIQTIEPQRDIPYSKQTKELYEDDNLEDEEPKNLEHEMSMSIHNNNNNTLNEYSHLNTNQSQNNNNNNNNIKVSSPLSNRNSRTVGGYNFFNPIDYNPNQHKGTHFTTNYISKKGKDRDEFHLRDKSFDYAYNHKSKQSQQGEKDRSPYFKRMAKLYTPKYKSKEKYELMKKEIENKFTKDHPFKPEINNMVNPKQPNETHKERIERLSQPRTAEIEERMKLKEQYTQQQINKNSNINPSNSQQALGRNINPASVSNRLYKLHEQMKEKKEKMKREFEDNKIKEYSFTPEINKGSKQLMQKYDQRPIYERNDDFERSKNENLLKMRQEIEREQLSYYKPVINEKSKELAKKSSQSMNDTDIHEKLYKENIRNEKHKHNNPQLDECTFSPKLYYETYDNDGGNIDDFLERQKVYEQLKKERLEKKITKSNEKNDYTFKPKINLTSDILMKTNSLRANEAVEDKIDRLYKQDFEDIQKRKEQLQSFYNAQYDFKPKINELSRFIGRDATITDLNQKMNVPDKLNKSQSFIDAECTFKPTINKEKFNHIQSNYKADEAILSRINDEVQTKKQKLTGMQSMQDKKNVVECKFKPDINRDVPNFESKEPMLMKGMAKHLEQMEKARKAKREKEEREKEVFVTGDNWSRDNLITVPKPFKLSYQSQQKKVDTSKKAKEMEMKECTFKPITNESKNREIIKQLLKD